MTTPLITLNIVRELGETTRHELGASSPEHLSDVGTLIVVGPLLPRVANSLDLDLRVLSALQYFVVTVTFLDYSDLHPVLRALPSDPFVPES
jgi:hypothetical protein